MADKKKTGKRTTVYRLTGVTDLRKAVREKYLNQPEFAEEQVTLAGAEGLLITGAMVRDEADWCGAVSALTGSTVSIDGKTPAGALLVRPSINTDGSDVAYALTYGMGFQILDPSRIDGLFGQRIAIRVADPDKLRSLTVTTMDDRARTSRATIPQCDGLLGFGVGDVGEAVSRIVAIGYLPELSSSSGDPLQIRGADALNVPMGLCAQDVISDIDVLEKLLTEEPPESLKILEQLAAVKSPEIKEELEAKLIKALGEEGESVGLSWPHERIDENGTPDAWKPAGLWPRGKNQVRPGVPEWSEVKKALKAVGPEQRRKKLSNASIQLFRDDRGEEPISQQIPLKRWIAFECDQEGKTYSLHDGAWYQIHQDYVRMIDARISKIFGRTVDLEIPDWLSGEDEGQYNERLAEKLNGICLDRKLIHTKLHRRGIEACDVYLDDGTLIHVKRVEQSSDASHLFAQALVSADALCLDEEARNKLRAKIEGLGRDSAGVKSRPKRIILAMHRKEGKRITAETLFTFTKVNLVRQVASLEQRGVQVNVLEISGCS